MPHQIEPISKPVLVNSIDKITTSIPRIPYDDSWGYERNHFLVNEDRYVRMTELAQGHLGDLNHRIIIDLGCCKGLLLERFNRFYKSCRLMGIEIIPEQAQMAKSKGIQVDYHRINHFDANDVMTCSLPYKENSFADLVFAGEIIEHIVDTESFLKEIYRTLKPGGCVVVSTPNVVSLINRLWVLLGKYPFGLEYKSVLNEGDFGHVRAFSGKVMVDLLSSVGFQNIHITGMNLLPVQLYLKIPPLFALSRFLDKSFPKLCKVLVASAEKPKTIS